MWWQHEGRGSMERGKWWVASSLQTKLTGRVGKLPKVTEGGREDGLAGKMRSLDFAVSNWFQGQGEKGETYQGEYPPPLKRKPSPGNTAQKKHRPCI